MQFRAPLLDRWVGVDVGRRVFRGQYAVESALALAAAAVAWQAGGGTAAGALAAGGAPLAGAAAALAAEAALVFPPLDIRGQKLIAASAQPEALDSRKAAYVAALRQKVAGRAEPPAALHLASVALALARCGLLASCVWGKLLLLGGGA